MAISKYSAALIFSLLPAALITTSLRAETVTVTLTQVGPQNNGTDFVLPYLLTISGDSLSAPVQIYADCYDLGFNISVGQSWQANILTLPQIATFPNGEHSGLGLPDALTDYEEVAYLSAQPTVVGPNAPTVADAQVALQQDIWNVFSPGSFVVSAEMQTYLNGLPGALSTYDFSPFLFLEGVTNDTNPLDTVQPLVQGFVYDQNIGGNLSVPLSPEPGSVFLMLGACFFAGAYWISSRRKRTASRNMR